MQSLASLLTKATAELGGEPAKFATIAKNDLAYRTAIKKVWKDSASSSLILNHTNAFYVRKDERPRKGKDKDKDRYLAEVVIDDPVIRSEIDTHREMIFCHMKICGLNIDELVIIPAKGNMRKKHPFAC
jgi:hypothetical protein